MRCTLRGARLVDAALDLAAGDLTFTTEHIEEVGAVSSEPGSVVDAEGMIVVPGFVDVHTHGGGGFNLHTADAAEIVGYAGWVPETGVTSFLVGVVGAPGSLPEVQLHAAVTAVAGRPSGAEPLGIHLEGPYLSEERRGAHLPAWLRTPNPAETVRLLALAQGQLRLVTLAPELPGAPELIRSLVAAGITVSIGHTDASYEQALEAIQLGATHATHCCNAMPPLHHRHPGPMGAVALAPTVQGEIIADGVHLHPAMLSILTRLLGAERAIVITDALAGAGCLDQEFEFAGQPAHVAGGAVRLADGTITGSVLTMDQALRNMLSMTGVSLQDAVRMMTLNPAKAAGAAERKGSLKPGYDADLVVLDDALTLQATYCRGALAFASSSWQARVEAGGQPLEPSQVIASASPSTDPAAHRDSAPS